MDNVGIVVDDLATTIEFFRDSASSSKGEPWWKESGQGASLDWVTNASRSP
jgi:hypothetical protein